MTVGGPASPQAGTTGSIWRCQFLRNRGRSVECQVDCESCPAVEVTVVIAEKTTVGVG